MFVRLLLGFPLALAIGAPAQAQTTSPSACYTYASTARVAMQMRQIGMAPDEVMEAIGRSGNHDVDVMYWNLILDAYNVPASSDPNERAFYIEDFRQWALDFCLRAIQQP